MVYRFRDCELDPDRHLFLRDGAEVSLEPQVFDLLVLLVSNSGRLLDRDRLMEEIWGGRIVSEATVSSRINSVRKAIGDDGKAQSMLQTVPRRGFRFVAEVVTEPEPRNHASPPDQAVQQTIRMTLSKDGTRIAYTTTGEGPPLLRAGHFLTHLELDWVSPVWRPLLDRLGASRSVTRYDQRTTGLSASSAPSLELDSLVDDLEAVAEAAGLRRFPIFAQSQGVPVAIAYASRHPDRVSCMVLYGGYAQGRTHRETDTERQNAEAVLTIIRQGWGRSGTAFATAFSTLYMPDATQEQLAHMTEMQLASATADNAVALRQAIDCFDVSGLLGEIRCPTLILHVQDDAVQPVEQAGVLAAGIPNAELRILSGCNHIPLPQDQNWSELLNQAETFLSKHAE
ncbi:alpha/beta fold hydrolase [Aliiruegeria sabulilitoris]|uniref:alpha/beta fold hydrolase n=1 Tax=Aliiruegeria sabulilitoris TaxID=1510458 RepID=UPI000835E0FF|nr:alpha/beta fold hydrolase [Aliiruegeria sabulilitoris]NDR58660.1 alpha/beta fold hydrolase [Pseudoruegeria sp. M32A2M]